MEKETPQQNQANPPEKNPANPTPQNPTNPPEEKQEDKPAVTIEDCLKKIEELEKGRREDAEKISKLMQSNNELASKIIGANPPTNKTLSQQIISEIEWR